VRPIIGTPGRRARRVRRLRTSSLFRRSLQRTGLETLPSWALGSSARRRRRRVFDRCSHVPSFCGRSRSTFGEPREHCGSIPGSTQYPLAGSSMKRALPDRRPHASRTRATAQLGTRTAFERRLHRRPAVLPRLRAVVVREADPEALETMAHSNPHSPPMWRVNGVIVNQPGFGAAYKCAKHADESGNAVRRVVSRASAHG
jgi:hypothetical protein